jgi:WS/DGAT/MGAT family acyltransferase
MIRVLLSMTEQDAGPAMAARSAGPPRSGTRPAPDLPDLAPLVEQLVQPAGDILEHVLAEGAHLLEQGVHQLFHPLRAAELAGRAGGMAAEFTRALAMPDDPDSPLRGPMSGVKRIAWTDPVPLDEVRTIGRALGCTVNDVLMSTVAGALGRHLRELDFDTQDLVLRASMPVNLRQAEEPLTLGNKFGLVFVELPLGIRNPLQRVFTVHDSMASLKGSLQPAMSLMTLGLMGVVPAAVQEPAIDLFSRKASTVISNVPGPQAPLKLCGQRICEMYFWVPQSGSIGVGISVLSYAGQVHFGVIADRELQVEPRRIAAAFGPEFERLLLATTVELLALRERDRKSAD